MHHCSTMTSACFTCHMSCCSNLRCCFRFLYALLAVTVGAFAGAIALIGVSFYWFNPAGVGDCSFNVFVMTLTILLTLGVSLGSLHPQVKSLQHFRICVPMTSGLAIYTHECTCISSCWPKLCLHVFMAVAILLLSQPGCLCQMHDMS